MRQIPISSSLLTYLDELEFTEAATAADPHAAEFAPAFEEEITGWPEVSQRERAARRTITRANAIVAVGNGQLDATTLRFGDHCFLETGRDRKGAAFRKFFPTAPSAFVNGALRKQCERTRDVIVPEIGKLAADSPLRAYATPLLDQAKAAGFDGKIRVLCTNQPERVALAQTLETQLKAVGFDVTARSDLDTAAQITEIVTNKDYDIACWGLSVPNDETAPLSLVQNFWSASPNNRVGYANPEWDAGLNVLLGAKDATARKAAYKTMADLWNKDVPSVVFNAVIERIAYQNKVHGVYANESSMFFLDKAWIEK